VERLPSSSFVRLPNRAVGVHRELVRIAEVVAQHLELRGVRLEAERHPFLVRLALALDAVARAIDDDVARRIHDRARLVAAVEVQPAIGTEDEGVRRVVVIRRTARGEQHLLLVRLVVAFVSVKTKIFV
jgi:hypothetical protein